MVPEADSQLLSNNESRISTAEERMVCPLSNNSTTQLKTWWWILKENIFV